MTFDLAQMRANRDAGTPGPWKRGQEGNLRVYGPDGRGDHSGLVYDVVTGRALKGGANARRIAAVPEMEAEIERLTAANESLRADLARVRDGAIREAATELEVNWAHIATPKMRDAILALAGIKEKTNR